MSLNELILYGAVIAMFFGVLWLAWWSVHRVRPKD
jgi:hypothetical protein